MREVLESLKQAIHEIPSMSKEDIEALCKKAIEEVVSGEEDEVFLGMVTYELGSIGGAMVCLVDGVLKQTPNQFYWLEVTRQFLRKELGCPSYTDLEEELERQGVDGTTIHIRELEFPSAKYPGIVFIVQNYWPEGKGLNSTSHFLRRKN